MFEEDSALNNLQWLICHQSKPNETKPIKSNPEKISIFDLSWNY